MNVSPTVAVAAVAVAGVGLAVWWVSRRGGVGEAASAIGAGAVNAAVDAAGGLVSGGVGAIGQTVGLPTPAQTTTDAAVARWIIDQHGYFEASKWASAPALARAVFMDSGSGTPPPAGSAAAVGLPLRASYDETERLRRRYPAPSVAEILIYELPTSQVAPYFAP